MALGSNGVWTLAAGAAAVALCLTSSSFALAGEPSGAKSSLMVVADATADSDVQKAEAALAKEDPTKIVKKAGSDFKPSEDPPVEQQANGMWLDKDGNPTPWVSKDGTPGWFVASGYRRYGANCLVCHGPDGLGSSYAPSLADALKTLTYPQFLQTVAGGKRDVSNSQDLVMPAFGDNKNVECYINDIYTYLRARALGLWGREQPTKHEEKPAIYGDQETACLGF